MNRSTALTWMLLILGTTMIAIGLVKVFTEKKDEPVYFSDLVDSDTPVYFYRNTVNGKLTEPSSDDSVSAAIEALDDQFMEMPEMKRRLSRKLLKDRACYVFVDGGYECWLPKAVCALHVPDSIGHDENVKVEATCTGYAQLVPVE
jgi:hypothetical protein